VAIASSLGNAGKSVLRSKIERWAGNESGNVQGEVDGLVVGRVEGGQYSGQALDGFVRNPGGHRSILPKDMSNEIGGGA
jgi:hypothetical protein